MVIGNGGDYHGDLTKKITHLITYKPEGAKYKHAKSWGLHLVSIEWLQDSLERGMILEETLYNPELPVAERGKGAWTRRKSSPLGKRSRDDSTTSLDEGKRKLRRTASTKLTSQNDKIWGDIVGGGNVVQAAVSFGCGPNTAEEATSADLPANAIQQKQSATEFGLPLIEEPEISRGIFAGCRFYIYGFDRRRTQVLEKHLISHEGQIAIGLVPNEKVYMVVPHSIHNSSIPAFPESTMDIQTVTDWWVERCIAAKYLVPPADYVLGRPFATFPLQRFDELTVCSTGFEGIELLHVSKAVALMGAKYEETFSKAASVLICNHNRNLRREKLTLANEWKIPVVSVDWLLDSIRLEARQPFKPYIQRPKKLRTESENVPITDQDVVHQPERPSTEDKPESVHPGSGETTRPAKTSKLDTTAFQDDSATGVKEEETTIAILPTTTNEPLNEITPNSPRKAPLSPPRTSPPKSPKPTALAFPPEIITTAISTLLAKSKNTSTNPHDYPEQSDASEGVRRKRAPGRILGRAASNVSATSRASSVDSTASAAAGPAVARPLTKPNSNSNSRRGSSSLRAPALEKSKSSIALIEDLLAQDAAAAAAQQEGDEAPPQTQMQYETTASSEYKASILAKARGVKHERKPKERVATIASLDAGGGGEARGRKGRALRDRGSGGLR